MTTGAVVVAQLPSFGADAFICPHCGVWAKQVWFEFMHRPADRFPGLPPLASTSAEERDEAGQAVVAAWAHTTCQKCGGSALAQCALNDPDDEVRNNARMSLGHPRQDRQL